MRPGELHGLRHSPGTERACWALDHHAIPYRFRDYFPLLSEPWLRWRLRRPFAVLTVPAFIGDGVGLMDSWDIALYADAVGKNPRLFPDERIQELEEWNLRAECLVSLRCSFVMNKLSLAERREKMRIVLNQARSELNQTGRSYLLGQFTYADIAMASALQMIEPVSDFYSRRGLAMRAAWTDKVLEAEFADLLEWRNQIYARNRIRQRLNEGRSTE